MCVHTVTSQSTAAAVKTTISTMFIGVIPLCLVIPTNIAIIVKLVIQSRVRHTLGATTTDEVTKITVMLLSITVSYIILSLPMTVVVFRTNAGQTQYGQLLLVAFSNLPYLNMSLNFYLYFLSGQMFRQEVREFLGRCFRCGSKAGDIQLTQNSRSSSTKTMETQSNHI